MNLQQAFKIISELEHKKSSYRFFHGSIDLWPLIRQSLWFELTSAQIMPCQPTSRFLKINIFIKKVLNYCISLYSNCLPCTRSNQLECAAFVSRPVYLQLLQNNIYFDRIVDPLLFSMGPHAPCNKYYLSEWRTGSQLWHPATVLKALPSPLSSLYRPKICRQTLENLAKSAGINPELFVKRVFSNIAIFQRWYRYGKKFFRSRSNLKLIYVTSWYFPDVMGLIAAARELNIKVVDVQHGKQGKLQAMYTGWSIPNCGYQMMPDFFWCWGQPSVDHILMSSPERDTHIPFVGGYPWIDYYRKYIFNPSQKKLDEQKKYVLVTLQPTQGDNFEPIPDFIVEYMVNSSKKNVFFIFRCHPNGRERYLEYCRRRLSSVPNHIYQIDNSVDNLYDRLSCVTHHITAYSSCCYEASVFGVPTLLFGADASSIYSDEIKNGLFTWTEGSFHDLAHWLEKPNSESLVRHDQNSYILSSLDTARRTLDDLQETHVIT